MSNHLETSYVLSHPFVKLTMILIFSQIHPPNITSIRHIQLIIVQL